MKKKTLFFAGMMIAGLMLAGSDTNPADLTPTELYHLKQRRVVIKARDIKGHQWPEVTAYALIDASPSECAAAFSYYPDQTYYSHNLTSATPLREVTSTDVHVSFKMDMPFPFSSSVTVTGNRLSQPEEGEYQIQWYFIRSNYSKDNHGKAVFSPFQSKTLYTHRNVIIPKSSLAGMFKKNMIRNTKSSAGAFVEFVEDLKKKHPERLKRYIRLMDRALKGEKIYTAMIAGSTGK